MTDRVRVYKKVSRTLKRLMKGVAEKHFIVLSMMVTGIVMGKKAQLSAMSSEVPHPAKDASIEKRMHRFVKDQEVDVETFYLPYASQILSALSNTTLFLVMDASETGRNCTTLMVGVIYKKRLLPLTWIVYKGKKGHTTAERHVQVLAQVASLVPKDADVVLLGDGEYDNIEMLAWVKENTNWEPVVRTSKSSILYWKGQRTSFKKVPVHRGWTNTAHQVGFTDECYGPLTAVVWWGKEYKEPIYLISTLKKTRVICAYYKKRFSIETLFSDQKSRGFHIHKSHVSDPERLGRLLLAACLAYLWMIYLGLEVLQLGKQHLIDRTERIDKSLFRLGLDWLKYLLKYGLSFSVSFIVPVDTERSKNVR